MPRTVVFVAVRINNVGMCCTAHATSTHSEEPRALHNHTTAPRAAAVFARRALNVQVFDRDFRSHIDQSVATRSAHDRARGTAQHNGLVKDQWRLQAENALKCSYRRWHARASAYHASEDGLVRTL